MRWFGNQMGGREGATCDTGSPFSHVRQLVRERGGRRRERVLGSDAAEDREEAAREGEELAGVRPFCAAFVLEPVDASDQVLDLVAQRRDERLPLVDVDLTGLHLRRRHRRPDGQSSRETGALHAEDRDEHDTDGLEERSEPAGHSHFLP